MSNGIRKVFSHVTPNHTLFNVDMPLDCANIQRFTPDGKYLISFTACQQGIRLHLLLTTAYDDPKSEEVRSSSTPSTFHQFFSLHYTRMLSMPDNHLLCKEFCLITKNHKHMILVSSCISTGSSADHRQSIPHELDITIQLFDYAFYIVELETGKVVDQQSFRHDYIHLIDHAGISIVEELFSVLCIQTQEIHVFKIHDSGRFHLLQSFGQFLHNDDELLLSAYEEAENQWHNDQSSYCTSTNSLSSEKDLNDDIRNSSDSSIGDWGKALPREEADSSRLMTAKELDTLLRMEGYYESADDKEAKGAPPYGGLFQALLSKLYKRSIAAAKGLGLQYFYANLSLYSTLKMWRMQFLGRNRLLIKMTTLPPNFLSPLRTVDQHTKVQSNTLFVIFNMIRAEIEDVFDDTSSKVADLLLNSHSQRNNSSIQPVVDGGLYKNAGIGAQKTYLTARGTTIYDRKALEKLIKTWRRPESEGSDAIAMQKLSLFLPRPPEMQPHSPYLDPSLFRYPKRMLYLQDRTKVQMDQIPFHCRQTALYKFMLDARTSSDEVQSDLRHNSTTITFIIPNPVYPFIITQRQSLTDGSSININFHVYKHAS
ncbi:De-etiolated protein 1 Det1-domain-containing protein [Zychaea mexicana]|uniref:De-etiolated protein 1 Det1-domain-containing protein n=1 Tax=Zychaea mexicana TaxID=64656 RepID=UPI0022FEDF7D|nr:De-etiolated protein 1 Det1-domain-containing protein [Zychaea mexicana]KAI9494863.1 De-etiolated protein 1 Det1-domain-containing protein [Zychaea mexicana]